MIVFPNCKINLGLNITRKRSDGFHDLDTFFYPLPFYDVLEIIQTGTTDAKQEDVSFTTSGITVDGANDNNLCMKAFRLLKKDFPDLPVVQIHLHKAIPIRAGLGGGSADAAFTLKLLNEKFRLNLSTEQLLNYALRLGSDCPFFIINKSCFATGRGELLEPLSIDLSAYKFILVNPGIHVPTATAFSQVTPTLPIKSTRDIIQQPVITWKDELKNDFEEVVFKTYPAISDIKNKLYQAGAVYASMSGSGSTVFGLFKKEEKVALSFPSHYFVKELFS